MTEGERYYSYTRNIHPKTRTLPRGEDGKVLHHMYNSDAFWLTQWNLNILWGLGWPEMMMKCQLHLSVMLIMEDLFRVDLVPEAILI